ncbi:prolipoprotein diacylglyceryl transferase [Propioniciclava soli]|uniref:prolipoprotein diacylglyceryl transferase n=1 Tax=Propioniciclava soli TaxID=2775081 RepID=UPI003CC821F6
MGQDGGVLLSIPSPDIRSFSLGPLTIHIYALCLMAGMAAAWWIGSRRWVARGGRPETFETIALWSILIGIVFARIYHVLTHWGDYFGPGRNPWSALYIWEGGIAIFGSLIGGALAAFLVCRHLGARYGAFADALAPGLIIAQGIGRLGNWFNQELFGGPDDGPLGLEIDPQYRPAEYADVATFQPTFLYEMTWNISGGLLLLWLDRRFKLGWGKVFALYMVIYGTGRFFIEGLRTDVSYQLGPLRTNQVTALLVLLGGALLFVTLTRLRPGREPWVERRGIGGPDAEADADPDVDADADSGVDADADTGTGGGATAAS